MRGRHREAAARSPRDLTRGPPIPLLLRVTRCRYNLGSAHHARKDIDRATYHFTRTIALDPNYADAHFNLGIVYQEMGELKKALQCYETASRLDPQLSEASKASRFLRQTIGTAG